MTDVPRNEQSMIDPSTIKESPEVEEVWESSYDYDVFTSGKGWGSVEVSTEGRGKYSQPTAEEIRENRGRKLHYGYNSKENRLMWSPIDKVPPKSDYIPKPDITQEELDTAIDSLQQRSNHINNRLEQSLTGDSVDTDDGITITSNWINKMIDEVRSRLSSSGKVNEYLLNPFYTRPDKDGKPEIPALQDPLFREILADGALEAHEEELFKKYLKEGTLSSYSTMEGEFVQKVIPHPEIAPRMKDYNWLWKRYTEHTNKYNNMKSEVDAIERVIRTELDSETKDYLMETLIDNFGWVRKDFTDRGIVLTDYARSIIDQNEWNDTREDMDDTSLVYPDGSFVPEGHYYDTATDTSIPIEDSNIKRELGIVFNQENVPEEVVNNFRELPDTLQAFIMKDQTSLVYPDGSFVPEGYYYDIEKDHTVTISEKVDQYRKNFKHSKEELEDLQRFFKLAQLQAGRANEFSSMSDKELEQYITSRTKKRDAKLKGITIGTPQFQTTLEAITRRFDERFGTNYHTWEDLNQGLLAGALSSRQIVWIEDMYRWGMQRLPKSSATATNLSKMEKSSFDRNNDRGFDVPWDPKIKMLLGGIDPQDLETILSDRGATYKNLWKEFMLLGNEWNKQKENYKNILLGNPAMENWDTEMVSPEMSRLDQVLNNMFLPIEQMLLMHASGELGFWEPGFEQWSLFAGRMYAKEYGKRQSGASDNFNTHLKYALHVIHTMSGEITPEVTSAMLFLFGLKAGSEEVDDKVFMTKALQAAGQPVEAAAILGVTLEYLLQLSGGDMTSLDPNNINQAVNTVTYEIASAISAASYAATTDRFALEALLPKGTIRDMTRISQNIRFRTPSAEAMEGAFDPEIKLGQEQAYELQQTEYDEMLRLSAPLLPSLAEGGEMPDVESIETLLVEAALGSPAIESLLSADWATDATNREKLLYVFRTMMLTEESALAFKGAMFTALIANKRTPMAGTTERNMMQMKDVFLFWETYLNRQNTAIIPYTYRNGEFIPATASHTKEYDYSKWANPTEEQPDGGVLNVSIYNDLNQTKETQAENDETTRRTMLRNFSNITVANPNIIQPIRPDMIGPAINKVMDTIHEINNQGKEPVGLIEAQLLLALELVEGEHKLDAGIIPVKLAKLASFVKAFREGDRLSKISYGLELGRSKTTGGIRGMQQAPHIRINTYEMETTYQPGGFAGLFLETKSEQKIINSFTIPWMAFHNDDWKGTTAEKEAGLQGSVKDFMLVSREDWVQIMTGKENIPAIGGYMEWEGRADQYNVRGLKKKFLDKYETSHNIHNGIYGIKVEYYGANGKWQTNITRDYTKVRVRVK